MEIRPEIMDFAEEMEEVMQKHDPKKGDSWKNCNFGFLISKLYEEIEELNASENTNKHELIDMGNICMMLFHRLKNKMYKTE